MVLDNCYFVTGTDTGVGKTFVSAALLWRARELGYKTAALKPVAAGAEDTDAGLRNEDGVVLQHAVDGQVPYDQINPFCLRAAIAPHIAAAEEGFELTVGGILQRSANFSAIEADFRLIEGAGGWRVPLNTTETFADLAVAFGCPVILVVAMRLGCINHALLSMEAIVRDGLHVAGWVANTPGEEVMSRYNENLLTLKALLDAPLLGEISYSPAGSYCQAAADLRLPGGLE